MGKKTALKKTPLNKSQSQKMAIQRLNKARETLQKAVKAVNAANKNLAKQMPQKKSKQFRVNRTTNDSQVAKSKRDSPYDEAMLPSKSAIADHLDAVKVESMLSV